MIRGERVVQWNMAMLILTGSLLLSTAQNNYSVLALTGIVVTFTLTVVDWYRWIAFPPLLANCLAFVVTLVTFTQFIGGDAGTKLRAVASLLTYIQLVLLLQRKTPRLYWQIMMLSLLQVVVAAALNLGFGAGLIFLGYIILVVTGTIHLKIFRGNFRLVENEKRNDELLAKLEPRNPPAETVGLLTFRVSELDFRNQKKIAWQGFLICICSVLFSFAVFYAVPRFDSAWYGPNANQTTQTGFTSEIRFDDDGFLQESNRKVFRASFLDTDNQPIDLAIEPYFRGFVLDTYSMKNGAWTWSNAQNKKPGRKGQGGTDNLRNPAGRLQVMRQLIHLEPAGKVAITRDAHFLFSMYPAFRNANTPEDVVYNRNLDLIFRDLNHTNQSESGPFKYEVLVPLYRRLGQLPAIPYPYPRNPFVLRLIADQKRIWLGKSVNYFETDWKPIKDLATGVIRQIQGPVNRRIICNRLVNFLRKADFTYTRNLGQIKKNRSLDPIVDFLINHKSGHCEYYATGLALMLRSQGIPCRLVTGFRGGDYNGLGGFYTVQEKHAHVWVEAYLEPKDCDQEMIATGQANEMGAWLRLDPTPGSDESVAGPPDLVDRAFDAVGFAQKLWDDYVMGLDHKSREFNGFDPTDDDSNVAWGIFSLLKRTINRTAAFLKNMSLLYWVSVVLILTLGSMLIFYIRTRQQLSLQHEPVSARRVFTEMFRASYSTIGNIRNRIVNLGRPDPQRVGYYAKFEEIISGLGIDREPSETQQEFAKKVIRILRERFPDKIDTIANSVQTITDRFYQQRFGVGLESDAVHSAKQAAQELAKCVSA